MRKTLLIVMCLCSAVGAQAVNRIAIKAIASEDYTKSRALDENDKVQTYVVMKGNYHPGTTFDPGMLQMTFEEIVDNLGIHLRRQNYYPDPQPESKQADLLLVIHWGRTSEETSLEELQGYTSLEEQGFNDTVANAPGDGSELTGSEMNAIADFGFNMWTNEMSAEGGDRSIYYKARLLGMEKAFSRNATPHEELLLKTLLEDERYFVVVMAYDFQDLKAGERNLLWETRYSIRAVGQTFERAIREMNYVAGDFFGKNIKDLTQRRIDDDSRVEMGEIEVLGQEETSSN